jgi:hypothetical protein
MMRNPAHTCSEERDMSTSGPASDPAIKAFIATSAAHSNKTSNRLLSNSQNVSDEPQNFAAYATSTIVNSLQVSKT